MNQTLRIRVVTLFAVFGALAAGASYVFGGSVAAALLVSSIALVAVVSLCLGRRVAAVTAVFAAAAFLYVELAGVASPVFIDFGSASAAVDLPALLRGASTTWLPTVLGVAALLIIVHIAGLLRQDLDPSPSAAPAYPAVLADAGIILRAAEGAGFRVADENSPIGAVAVADDSTETDGDAADAFPLAILRAAYDAGFHPASDILSAPDAVTALTPSERELHAARWAPQAAALVRVSLQPPLDDRPGARRPGQRLLDMVWSELGGWQETAVVKRDAGGDVLMLLPGADQRNAYALVHRLEETAHRQFRRSLGSVVLALVAAGQPAEQTRASDLEMRLEGRPFGARVTSPEAQGGS
ncbi:MAG: hypothetical protein M3019_06340 [Candidatus Dormibacteraeota bacterium]|nr:hypothetical protein [Candidatus Dormibacteraeota bacterium]